MGIPPYRRTWGTFYCEDCDDVFADVLPAIHEELPQCHVCAQTTRIWGILSHDCWTYSPYLPKPPI